MEFPLLSVIVPIYNVEGYLERCIDSIINQTYKNLEIILVDDGSPDNSPKICDYYVQKDNRIKVIHKENGGLSDARNTGTSVSTGELIAYIDSDDWIDQDMFEKMYICMQHDGSDIVSSGVKWVKEDGSVIKTDSSKESCVMDTTETMNELLSDRKFKQHVWNKLYKADLIKNIPFAKGKYHEDVFWSYQAVGVANKVSIMTEAYYNYVQREGSIMGESYSAKRLDALDAMKQRCQYMKIKFPSLYNKSLFVYIGSCMYHMQLAMNVKAEKNIIKNIKNRIIDYKKGNIFGYLSGKQKIWIHMFVKFPHFTCKIRNILKIGL